MAARHGRVVGTAGVISPCPECQHLPAWAPMLCLRSSASLTWYTFMWKSQSPVLEVRAVSDSVRPPCARLSSDNVSTNYVTLKCTEGGLEIVCEWFEGSDSPCRVHAGLHVTLFLAPQPPDNLEQRRAAASAAAQSLTWSVFSLCPALSRLGRIG